MRWTWEQTRCGKSVQRSCETKPEPHFVKVPAKLLVVVQSAAASSSAAASCPGGDAKEDRVQNTAARWLPDLDELIRYLPPDLMARAGTQDSGKLLESLAAGLGPEIHKAIRGVVDGLKGGVKP